MQWPKAINGEASDATARSMKVIDGEIGVVGREHPRGRPGKSPVLSVLEIGEHQLKRIVLSEPLRKPIATGKHARILLGRGLSQGLVTRPYVAAVEVDGKKYKKDLVIRNAMIKILIYGGIGYVTLSRISVPLALVFCGIVAVHYVKDSLDLVRF
jgi:hypothetical protein